MDFVTFAFCDAVTSILGKNSLEMIIPQLGNSAKRCPWKCAFTDHFDNRMELHLKVFSIRRNWFYALEGGSGLNFGRRAVIELEEVQKTPRKYVHLQGLTFGKSRHGLASSLDEIRSVLNFVRPYVDGWTELWLCQTDAPREELVDLLSPFCSSPFRYIYMIHYEEAFEEILREQIKLSTLRSFGTYDKSQPAVELVTEFNRIQTEARLARSDAGGGRRIAQPDQQASCTMQ